MMESDHYYCQDCGGGAVNGATLVTTPDGTFHPECAPEEPS